MAFLYLASPYSHPDPAVMEERYRLAMLATHLLMKDGSTVFSPIVYSHELAKHHNRPKDSASWWYRNRDMLRHAHSIGILTIDGWKESVGLAQELKFAKHIGLLDLYYELRDNQILFAERP